MIRFLCVPLTSTSRTELLNAARQTLIKRLRGEDGEPISCPSEELSHPAGCFVTLHEMGTGKLRGCVGRLDPAKSLWSAVCATAADVLRDPRFTNQPVTLADARMLEIEISVLSPPREAASPMDFELLDDGIYLLIGQRAGFFLPQVARDTGWSKEQLLARLCTEKLGMPADAWKLPDAKLLTFKVEVIGPEPLVIS